MRVCVYARALNCVRTCDQVDLFVQRRRFVCTINIWNRFGDATRRPAKSLLLLIHRRRRCIIRYRKRRPKYATQRIHSVYNFYRRGKNTHTFDVPTYVCLRVFCFRSSHWRARTGVPISERDVVPPSVNWPND